MEYPAEVNEINEEPVSVSELLTDGGLTSVRGILTAGINCGIKKQKKDLAIIFSEKECTAAGVFTVNPFRAAPVIVSEAHLQSSRAQAIIVNSGNANACTGDAGLEDAEEMARIGASALEISSDKIIVSSTGMIGQRLPMDKIRQGIPAAALQLSRSVPDEAVEAIMTTDTFPKSTAVEMDLSGHKAYLAGIAKGAGMIKPNMATMLSFLCTDVSIDAPMLKKALHRAVDESFHAITIDGDTSTNDMVIILANGLAGNTCLTEENSDFATFQEALNLVTLKLAKMIVRDGEGATKLVEIRVRTARSCEEARKIAYTIAESPLVKTSFCAERCMWGRILAAIGYSGIPVEADKVDLFYGPVQVVSNGSGTGREAETATLMKDREIQITVDLNLGQKEARIYTCDLSKDYVNINMGYS
ncbi:MAG: bifunctional glutamate N-acetyltransferase/amino-acid acetyltransferase ArgJ [bacterium]